MQGKFKRIVLRNFGDLKEYKERTGEIGREKERVMEPKSTSDRKRETN